LPPSSLLRGYVATFEIKDNQLYVKDIEVLVATKNEKGEDKFNLKSIRNEIFPNQEFIKVDWMTGLLILPSGSVVNYVHLGYGSTYEHYTILEIENGNFKNEQQLEHKDYVEFRDKQFQAFKKTDEYKKIKDELQNGENSSDDSIDSFIRDVGIEYKSKILVQ